MTTSYSTTTTITDTLIIVRTLANNQEFINYIPRGPNENDSIKAIAVRHKERSDAAIGVDDPARISARLNKDITSGIRATVNEADEL